MLADLVLPQTDNLITLELKRRVTATTRTCAVAALRPPLHYVVGQWIHLELCRVRQAVSTALSRSPAGFADSLLNTAHDDGGGDAERAADAQQPVNAE